MVVDHFVVARGAVWLGVVVRLAAAVAVAVVLVQLGGVFEVYQPN